MKHLFERSWTEVFHELKMMTTIHIQQRECSIKLHEGEIHCTDSSDLSWTASSI